MKIRILPRWCFVLATMFTIHSVASAQDTIRLSMEQAVEIALSESPIVKVADKEIERKDYIKKERLAGLIPALNASGSYSRNFKNQAMAMRITQPNGEVLENIIEMGFPNSVNASFSLALPIYAPTLWQNIKLTQVDIERSVEAARTSRLNLVKSVKEAYYGAMLSIDAYNVLKNNYTQTVENARVIKEKFKHGVASEYEVLRSGVSVRNLEPSLLQAESGVELALLQLKVLIGVDLDLNVAVIGELADYESQLTELDYERSHILSMLDNAPTMRQLDMELKYLSRSYQLQRSQRLPTLSASGVFGYSAMEKTFEITNYNWRSHSNAGLTLSIPLFEGFAKNHREKQTRIAMESLKIQREDAERNLVLAMVAQRESIVKTVKQIASNKEGMAMAVKGYEIAQKRYETGAGSYIEMNDADLAKLQSQLTYRQAIHDYLVAKVNLENLLGTYELKQ